MGKLILCCGERTKRAYVFEPAGIRVYSIEEICYYLYHHVYTIDDDLFCDALFDFIDKELKLSERADKLRLLKKQNADIKTMVTVIFCSADYYSENEIKKILKILDEIIGMPPIKRKCMKACDYLKEKHYSKAASEYEHIINSKDATQLTPEEYGNLFHNLAVAKVHITGYKEASKLFYQAFERNHRKESLEQYLYTLRLCGSEDEYRKKAEEYEIGPELDYAITENYNRVREEAEKSNYSNEIVELNNLRVQGKINEFYQKTDELIDLWKDKVRQS